MAVAFGAVLRAARTARGLSQEDLAGDADVDRTYPSLLERGHRVPTLVVFLRLCAALRQSPAELIAATVAELARGAGAPPPMCPRAAGPAAQAPP